MEVLAREIAGEGASHEILETAIEGQLVTRLAPDASDTNLMNAVVDPKRTTVRNFARRFSQSALEFQ